jgi:ssDNA-binding Zn-finger/Zn-ribbon topoisomerase 1
MMVKCPHCKEGTLEECMEQDSMTEISDVECDSCDTHFTVKRKGKG